MGDRRPAAEKYGVRIRPEQVLPIPVSQIGKETVAGDPRVVDQKVCAAHLFEHGFYLIRLRHIRIYGEAADLLCQRLGSLGGMMIGDGHMPAVRGKSAANGSADPARATGDQSGLSHGGSLLSDHGLRAGYSHCLT